MANAQDVARYFLALTDEDDGDLISNLKLQKLLYYAQGLHLAVFDRPLFEERIEAWAHGPVVPQMYHAYKEFGSGPIPQPADVDFSVFEPEARELLDEVYSVFGQFSAWKLREMTHGEDPWVKTPAGEVITHRLMRDYFKSQIVEN